MFKLKPKLSFALVISNLPNENKVDQKLPTFCLKVCLIFKLKKPGAKGGPHGKFGACGKNRTMKVVRTLPFCLIFKKLHATRLTKRSIWV